MLSYDMAPSVASQSPKSPATVTVMPVTRTAMPATPKTLIHHGRTSSGAATLANGHTRRPENFHHQIWLVTGPAGSGKSTVAKHLAASLNYPYIEGDEVG